MAAWPQLDELKQVLDSDPETDVWDGDTDPDALTRLSRALQAAIDRVKQDVGPWADDRDPTDREAQAAMRMAELLVTRPMAPMVSLGSDPTYRTLLKGARRRWGIA